MKFPIKIMKEVTITVNGKDYQGMLNETETAEKVYNALPVEDEGQLWGDEIYFEVPVRADNEQPTEDLEVGDLAYWPQGNSLCIFYGETPASTGDKPKPAGPVTVVGKVKGDLDSLKNISQPHLKVTKSD